MEAGSNGALSRLVHSFSFKLALLALILLSVPLILYWQFVHAEREQELVLSRAVDQTNRVTAVLLTPRFERFSVEPASKLQEALAHASGGHTHIKVLMRLAGAPPDDFLYVASQPVFPKQ
jgi:two-component system sensor histidine kinase ChvG